MSEERDRLERAKAKMNELTLGREYDAAWRAVLSALEAAEKRIAELERRVAKQDGLIPALKADSKQMNVNAVAYQAERERAEKAEAENEALRAERDALAADLSLAMSYYISDNRLGLDYHGADEDFARKSGGKVNAEMERWKRTLGFGEDHRKHPTGDRCVFCNSQWPCEFAPEEVL